MNFNAFKTVFQIAIGTIPEEIRGYMSTVQQWAENNGYDYKVITEQPKELKDLSLRIASDWMRIKILLENPYHLYIDWDVELIGDVKLGETPILTPYFEHFIYNGSNTNLFKEVYKNMVDRKIKSGNGWKDEEGIIFKSFRNININKEWFVNSDGLYIHKWNSKE